MRKLLGVLVAVVLMAGLFTFAAPVHADPPAPQNSCWSWVPQAACDVVAPVAAAATAVAVPGGQPAVAGVANNASQVVDFVKDPLGYIGAAVMGAATFVLAQVASLANASTAPDLSLDFWKSAYAQAWSIGLVLLCFVLLWEFGNLVLRRVTPAQFMGTLTIWAPAALGAMLFGPMIAQVLIQGSTFLADGLIKHMVGFGGSDSFNAIDKSIQNASIFGGGTQGPVQGFLAIFFGLAMLIAAVFVYLSLAFQALIMYLSTAAFAIVAAWMASTHTRKHTFSYARMFVAACFAKVTVIFVLGVVLAMATAATAITGDGVSKDFALIVMAILGMFLAAFAPMLLGKHAPVMPGMAAAGVGAGIAGSAVGWTAGSAAARGAGRGMKAGGSKLGAVTSRKGAAAPPPGAPPSGAHLIDGPVPTPASKTGNASRGGSGTGTAATAPSTAPGREGTGSTAQGAAAAARQSGRTIDPPVPGSSAPAPGSSAPASGGAARSDAWKSHKGEEVRHPAGRQPDAPQQRGRVGGDVWWSAMGAQKQAGGQSKLNGATPRRHPHEPGRPARPPGTYPRETP